MEESDGYVQRQYRRKLFTPEEDTLLRKLVKKYGSKKWGTISQIMKNRTAKQCRDRYISYLRPCLNSGPWTEKEEQKLFQKYMEIGPKWVKIARSIPGRSGNSVKNHFNYMMKNRNKEDQQSYTVDPPTVEKSAKDINQTDTMSFFDQILKEIPDTETFSFLYSII